MSKFFHNTVAAIVEKDGKFLMVEERTRKGIKINQPTGHVELGETLAAAVIRETMEETAFEFIPKKLLGVYKWQEPINREVFIRYAIIGKVGDYQLDTRLDSGIIKTHWLTPLEIKQAENKRSVMVNQCIEDYLTGNYYPLAVITELE